MDVIRTQGDIAGLKAQTDPAALAQAREQLKKDNKPFRESDVLQRAYNNAMQQYGTGSDLQKAAQAVTGALTALAGNNLAGALASGASPYLATEIKKLTTNPLTGKVDVTSNAMAHAVLGAVTAQLNNQSAVAGGLGAGGGELAARYIAGQLFPGKTADQLSESEKQQVSALSQLAAGLAGGLATGDTGGAVTAAQAGKNAVENNALHADQIDAFAAKAKGCEVRGDCQQVVKEMEDLSLKQQKEMIAVCASDPKACKATYGDIPANGMLVREAIDRVLGNDVPSKMKNDMSSLLAQQIEAEGVVSSTEFANQLQSRYDIDPQQAEIYAAAALGAVTGGMGKGGKPAAGTEGKNIVLVDSGKKGAWNKAMNKPEPNTVYKVDGNKTFQTDEQGRTSFAEGTLSWGKNDRNTYQQCKAGQCGNPGDEGGHLIASIFNGPGEKLNLVPMDGNLNKGVWKQMENTWASALRNGQQVNVKIAPVYIGDSKRPDSFSVIYSIDGARPVIKDISNTPGGLK
ncbi:DNA/RNA non-specific endonuclease [Erwinia aphidicola]|uniref:DNA/RNA non-specific endonuclease n=1 Tax=Erwinia aphidicola TaxID=68334 RepID=UPI003016D01C